MNASSEAKQIETAVRFVLMVLRDGSGQMPLISRRAMKTAARILHLDASLNSTWRAPSQDELAAYLDAAGFTRNGQTVDYEKFYAHREAWEKKRASKKRRRQSKA